MYYGKHRSVVRRRLLALKCVRACAGLLEGGAPLPSLLHCASRPRPAHPPPPPTPTPPRRRRERLARGEAVDDDLSDLADPDLLAELAAENRMADLKREEAEDEGGDADPLGLGAINESGGCSEGGRGWEEKG